MEMVHFQQEWRILGRNDGFSAGMTDFLQKSWIFQKKWSIFSENWRIAGRNGKFPPKTAILTAKWQISSKKRHFDYEMDDFL